MDRHPCRNTCSHSVGDEICRGCFRDIEQVRDWNSYTKEQKKEAVKIIKERIKKR